MSITSNLTVKYRGVTKDISSDETVTTIIYQATKDICEQALTEDEYKINYSHPSYGNIDSIRLYQEDGPIWNLEVKYATEGGSSGGGKTSKGTSTGAKSSELTIRMISLPLESLKDDYRMMWNNNLYCTKDIHYTPSWADDATLEDDKIKDTSRDYPGGDTDPTSKEYFAWGASIGELDPLPRKPQVVLDQ